MIARSSSTPPCKLKPSVARSADRQPGRLAEPEAIAAAADAIVTPPASLAGYRVLVTAGPTIEDLDPVRFIGNRSSGRMGFALAEQAQRRGAHVVLVAGPTTVEPPSVTRLIRVRSAREMHAAVLAEVDAADVVIMAAAVADYTPADGPAGMKLAKGGPISVALERTVDVLADLGQRRGDQAQPVLVGFAAESGDPIASARRKLEQKRVDLIVANDITSSDAGFDVETNRVSLVGHGATESLPLLAKSEVAAIVIDRVEHLLASKRESLSTR